MGKASKWLRGLLGMKKDKENVENFSNFSDKTEKKRWSFGRSSKDSGDVWMRSDKEIDYHAIAVAVATAAAADAAVAAAQAAVAVVRLTSRGRGALFATHWENWAAVKIQSVFRGYLARKALKALKGLVKLQAIVRGYLVRKRAAATLHSMQALIRAQAAVRSQRIRRITTTDLRLQAETRARKFIESKRLSASYDSSHYGTDESSKIVEINTYKLRSMSHRIKTTMCNSGNDLLDWSFLGDECECECKFPTAQNTPRGQGSNFRGYMARTESVRAKERSVSAPKQRANAGRKRISLEEIMGSSRSSYGGGGM